MGVDKKTTLMVIKVDLQCCRCYKKIKKVLCGIPQIQDQVYNEKENFVIIKVVCCSPEKIKQKIICEGGCAVKSIEIKEVDKPKEPEKPKEKPKESEKKKEEPKKEEAPKKEPKVDTSSKDVKSNGNGGPSGPGKPTGPLKAKEPEKPPPCPPQLAYPVPFGTCCTECYVGRGGGPCYSGHGRPPPGCDGYYGRPIYDSYGGGGGYGSSYASRCDYFSEENSSGCSIM
ncbi:uncharacterized protein LOC142637252 [Castanea sativa]|uniref:uncharacterized protein LOC142637252 n=1 Tax=Castanea sativa TaxID=21020 RepID=UPI003F6519D9